MELAPEAAYGKPSHGRKHFVWIAAACALVIAIAVYAISLRGSQQPITEQAAEPFSMTPPSSGVMCRGLITFECAQRAADTVGLDVAWASVPSGFGLDWFQASRVNGHPYSEVVLQDHASTAQIRLGTMVRFPQLPVVGRVTHGSETATVSRQLSGATEIELEWIHDGTRYSMLGLGALDLKTLVRTWRSVRYAAPSPSLG